MDNVQAHGKDIVLYCVDERYSNSEVRALLPNGYQVTAIGGSLVFQQDGGRSYILDVFRDIRELLASHSKSLNHIHLVDHFGQHGACLAYGDDNSRERHENNLRAAAKIIAAGPEWEGVSIRLWLHDIPAGTIEEVPLKEGTSVAA